MRKLSTAIMVLLISGRKWPVEGRLDSDWNASKLHGITILTLFCSLARIKAASILMAAPTTKG